MADAPDFSKKNEWPDDSSKHDVFVGDWLKKRKPEFLRWLQGSPRRGLSGEGAKARAVIARRRRWAGTKAMAVNLPPLADGAWLDSIDFVAPDSSGWAALPPGATVEKIASWDGAELVLELALTGAAAKTLGAKQATVRGAPAAFLNIPLPWVNPKQCLSGWAALMQPAAKVAEKVAEKGAAVQKREAKADLARRAAAYKAVWKSVAKAPPLPEPWRRLLDDALGRSPLAPYAAAIHQLALPALAFQEAPSRAAPVGGSRVGGCPDLPAGTPWPMVHGERLSFLVQLNLADVPPAIRGNLPTRGLLAVFLGQNESTRKVEHQVQLLATRRLGRAGAPHADSPWRDPQTGLLEPVRLVPSPMVSLPGYGTTAMGALAEKWGAKDLVEAYQGLRQALQPKGDLTRLWGWSDDPDETGRGDGRLFLAIGSHRRAKLSFWDAGQLEIESQGAQAPGRTTAFIATS